ncbi:MAG: class II aldolase/adducin family protein [Chloroflexota bacterium]|nr:class II aldolase/adducin family protein [Chloroflexota bacterium]
MTTPTSTVPAELLRMTRLIGVPAHNLVVVGEGNTSMRVDADSFWIKCSGRGMHEIDERGFVQIAFAPILDLFDSDLSADALQTAMMDARVDPSGARPSVEVTFHASVLHGCAVNYIGHTHPLAVNGILCSTRAEQFAKNRLFPDEAVLCGPESVFVPYTDPGLPLARAIRDQVRLYMDQYEEAPKVILLQNHGLIVVGNTAQEILNVTAMCVKAAGIFTGACAVGEPVFMSREDIMHIYKRPDEIYRRQLFVG